MKSIAAGMMVAALAAVAGCNTSPPGGPGATGTGTGARATNVAPADSGTAGKAQFRLSGPLLATAVKKGEKKEIAITITRENGFDQDVQLKLNVPKGLRVTPDNPVIKAGDKDVKIYVEVGNDAPTGKQTINVTGVPAKTGAQTTLEVPVTVENG